MAEYGRLARHPSKRNDATKISGSLGVPFETVYSALKKHVRTPEK
jgi:hypothetical protein